MCGYFLHLNFDLNHDGVKASQVKINR